MKKVRAFKTHKREEFTCLDGPLKNIELKLGEPSTLIFTMYGQTGRYIKQPGYNHLKWEPANGKETKK